MYCGQSDLSSAWTWLKSKADDPDVEWIQAGQGTPFSLVDSIVSVTQACHRHYHVCSTNCPFASHNIVLLALRNAVTVNPVFVVFQMSAIATYSKTELIFKGKPFTEATVLLMEGMEPGFAWRQPSFAKAVVALNVENPNDFVVIDVAYVAEEMPFPDLVDRIRKRRKIQSVDNPAIVKVQCHI